MVDFFWIFRKWENVQFFQKEVPVKIRKYGVFLTLVTVASIALNNIGWIMLR
jgi:hypothetical protein